ncbi:MAG: hypothetical protein ACYCZF_10235 [Anaerolineae bacterium]
MSVLKIDMTYQCSAQCEHYRFRCTRKVQPVIDLEMVRGVIWDLKRLNKLELVVLLGGQ